VRLTSMRRTILAGLVALPLGLALLSSSGVARADALHEQSVRLQVQADAAQDAVDAAKKVVEDAERTLQAAIKVVEKKAAEACEKAQKEKKAEAGKQGEPGKDAQDATQPEKATEGAPPKPTEEAASTQGTTAGEAPSAGQPATGEQEPEQEKPQPPPVLCQDDKPKNARSEFFAALEGTESAPEPFAESDDAKAILILGVCGAAAADGGWPSDCVGRVEKALEARSDLVRAKEDLEKKTERLAERMAAVHASLTLESSVTELTPGSDLAARLRGVRKVRCMTAYCWGGVDGSQYAIEPIVDLPIGLSWAVGSGGLANYINGNRIDVSVSAGIRVWFAYDIASFGVLLARPSLTNTTRIYTEYSDKVFTSNSVNRPYPTLVLGLWGDIFSITASYDQLRNTDGSNPVDSRFLPNEVLSRAFVFGISINTITAARNAIAASWGSDK
jgi:hypothetical protein